jgi:hypothetical protein
LLRLCSARFAKSVLRKLAETSRRWDGNYFDEKSCRGTSSVRQRRVVVRWSSPDAVEVLPCLHAEGEDEPGRVEEENLEA